MAPALRRATEERRTLTVCVAAICGGDMICGMTDRMLTAGDIQFQPSSAKIWPFTRSIVMLSSGDVGLQTEIYSRLMKHVIDHIKAQPDVWLCVEDIAALFSTTYFVIKKERAEREILTPLGLNSQSLLTSGVEPELASKISMELLGYRMPESAVIIAGNNAAYGEDQTKRVTAHIFVVQNGQLSCADKVGFACIGAGSWHANSAMMLAGHTPNTPIPRGLLNVCIAKKRAEVAPGVGPETDTFVVTNSLGGYSELRDAIRERVFKVFREYMKKNDRADKNAAESLDAFIQEIISTPKPESEPQTAEPPTTH
jgi:hypothetical protein